MGPLHYVQLQSHWVISDQDPLLLGRVIHCIQGVDAFLKGVDVFFSALLGNGFLKLHVFAGRVIVYLQKCTNKRVLQ